LRKRQVVKMTVKMKEFGEYLVTRQDAKVALQAIGAFGLIPKLDFSGVKVANHGFADELWKGLASKFSASALPAVEVTGANEYVENCLDAGLATAV